MATASDITSGLTGALRGLSATARNLGVAMTGASAIAGAALFTLSQRAERVDAAFREVDTLVQGAANSQERYGELTSDLNTKMGLQADRLEVIEGLYQSISAGIGQTTEAQREFLTTASKLAVVGRVDLGTSVDVLSTVMNTYGLEAEQAQDVSESLFQTVQFGKTRMEDLAPVLGRVAALGSNLSIQIDEIGAAMGVLTRTGFGARVAATGLRNIFRAMMRPSETMQKQLRAIALEQDLFADAMGNSEEQVRQLADEYRNASSAVEELTAKQKEARNAQEDASVAIQEARLKIQAIEENRLEQLPELTNENIANADSIQELQSIINDYQFQVNKARVAEENARLEREEKETQLQNIRDEFKSTVDVQGDLEGGIGNLVLQNQDFVDTLVQLRERTEEQNIAFNELFPRTRALQGALALVGDDGEALTNIFEQMEEGTFDAAEAWTDLDESAKENFDSFEEFQSVTEEVTSGDLNSWFEQAQGPQQQLRNSISKLQESLSSLGRVFTEDLTDAISTFANNVNNLTDRFANMQESVRENISEFTILAVTLGLVLGPLLLFGGQIALIAQAMGSMFIPFILLSGSAMGVLAGALSTAVSGGEEAQSMFGEMRSFLTGLVDTVNYLRRVFVEETLPGIIIAGQGVVDVFSAIFDELTDGSSEGGSLIRQFASLWGQAFALIGNTLSNNADQIANFVGIIVDGFINKVVPAAIQLGSIFFNDVLPKLVNFIRNDVIPVAVALGTTFFNDVLPSIISVASELVNFFASSVVPVLQDAWSTFQSDTLPWIKNFITSSLIPAFQSLGIGILDVVNNFIDLAKQLPTEQIIAFLQNGAVALLKSFTNLIETLGTFISENSQLITYLITATAIFAGLSKVVGPIITAFTALKSASSLLANAFANGLARLVLFLGRVIILGRSVLSLKGVILALKGAIALLGGPITIIIGLIALLAAAWATDFMGMRKTLQPLVDLVMYFANAIISRVLPAFMNLFRSVKRFGVAVMGLIVAIGKLVGWFGKAGGQSFALGMAFKVVKLIIDAFINIVVGLIQIFAGLFDLLTAVVLFLQGDFSGAWKAAQDGIGNFVSGSIKLLQGFVKAFIAFFLGIPGILLGIIMDIVAVILKPFQWVYNKLVGNSIIPDMVSEIIDSFLSIPGKIIKGLKKGFSNVVTKFGNFMGNLLNKVKEGAKKIPKQMKKGVKENVDKVKNAANDMAGEVRDRLPFSPPKKGPMSKPDDPRSSGNKIASDTAKGIRENKDEVAEASSEMAEEYDIESEEEFAKDFDFGDAKDFESKSFGNSKSDIEKLVDSTNQELVADEENMKIDDEILGGGSEFSFDDKNMKGLGDSGSNSKIVVDKHAVYFEKGAFQGVSDDEIPKRVREEVDDSMKEIVRTLEASGKRASIRR